MKPHGLVEGEQVVPHDDIVLRVGTRTRVGVIAVITAVETIVIRVGISGVERGAEFQPGHNVVFKKRYAGKVLRVAVILVLELDERIFGVEVDGVDFAVLVIHRIVGTHADELVDHVVLIVGTPGRGVHIEAKLEFFAHQGLEVESHAEIL